MYDYVMIIEIVYFKDTLETFYVPYFFMFTWDLLMQCSKTKIQKLND